MAKLICKGLGELAGTNNRYVAESLGIDIDLAPGVPQRKWAKSATQKKRLKAAAARTARLKKLRKQVGGRISKIANQLIPAVIFMALLLSALMRRGSRRPSKWRRVLQRPALVDDAST